MDSLEDTACWDFLDYSFIDQAPPDFLWSNHSVSTEIDIPGDAVACPENTKKRGRTDSCFKAGSKACREKLRRERLNERFCDLSAILEPGRPVRTDKPAILDDAIRVLSQLKTESEELKKSNEKLLEEIKCLKAEKNELREEKLVLKADKERIEKQLKGMAVAPAGFMAPPVAAAAAAYQAGMNKMAVYPNYGYIPMWQYLPPSSRDTSHDHELRPPAA
ncbi:transcription factor bHLH104 [Cajanus cajan]|uniref:Transcription factor bHLH104 family n=1 Tax=Cajanus cajan TaxID=3821 RepID=A0A151T1V7_CAJCA|nr:transcription factor bHLH104 [Cajanus cajan]KYP61052.1 Transcription factor bHLH104 family [Cajanus cajan]